MRRVYGKRTGPHIQESELLAPRAVRVYDACTEEKSEEEKEKEEEEEDHVKVQKTEPQPRGEKKTLAIFVKSFN